MDIDGTAGYFHEHFIRFAAMYLQRQISLPWTGEKPFWQHLGVSKLTYRQIKLCYRQGAIKRSMPVVLGAPGFTRAVRRAGAELWVCTTRPYLRLDNIDPDTRFWLRHNGFQHDGVLFGESKYRDLAQLVGSHRVVGVLDDDPEQIERAKAMNLNAFLMNREYNQNVTDSIRFPSMEVATKYFLTLVRKWKEERGIEDR